MDIRNRAKNLIARKGLSAVISAVITAICLSATCASAPVKSAGKQPVDYVDTRIGTKRWAKNITVSQVEDPSGFVYPGVGEPFAMTEWSPQTSVIHMAHLPVQVPYWWDEGGMQGFRGTHYPSGSVMSDYGCITIMPMTGPVVLDAKSRASGYRHESEIAKPHYYAVTLDDYDIRAEFTAADQTGFFRFTYPKSDTATVLIDPVFTQSGGYFRVIPDKNEIEGISFKSGSGVSAPGYAYFVARSDKPFKKFGVYRPEGAGKIIPSDYWPHGLKGSYFNNADLAGEPAMTRMDGQIDFSWSGAPAEGVNKNEFSVRWTGKLTPRKNGIHRLTFTYDDGASLFIDGRRLIDEWGERRLAKIDQGKGLDLVALSNQQQMNEANVTMMMEKGREYDVRVEYRDNKGAARAALSWIEPGGEDAAAKAALSGSRGEAAFVSFETTKGEKVRFKVGTSFISIDQARKNLEREIPGWDFESAANRTRSIWNKALGKIEVEGDEEDKTIFYTAMQRAQLLPRNMSEGGYYRSPYDGKVYPGVMYVDFSMWDTFRAEHPLLIFLQPEKVSDMIRALLNAYDEGGWIPKFPSPGYSNVMMATHGDSVIADAYIKGIRGFNAEKAFEAMLKNTNTPGDRGYEARDGILDYIKLGFVPVDGYSESVACTMEYAYDDFCVAQMAEALGRAGDHAKLMERALYYKHVLDPETMLIRAKTSTGAWRRPDDQNISVWARGAERDMKVYKWNYSLFAPQDPQGLINFFGGRDKFEKFLDDFFGDNLYYVGDEFSMHAPYLYNYVGAPWKTQKQLRALLSYYFATGPGGMCGNDDAGQLSSWYIFGAMGFTPSAPAARSIKSAAPYSIESHCISRTGKPSWWKRKIIRKKTFSFNRPR